MTNWDAVAQKALVGKTITNAYYMTSEEATDFGWESRGVVLELSDGLTVIVQQDDEGNGPGALLLLPESGASSGLPVLWR